MLAKTETYLGRVCKRGHVDAQGKCLRYRSGGTCVQCVQDHNHARRIGTTIDPVDRRGAWGPDPKLVARDAAIVAAVQRIADEHRVSIHVVRRALAHARRASPVTADELLADVEPVRHAVAVGPELDVGPPRPPSSAEVLEAERIAGDRWLEEQLTTRGLAPRT